MYQRGQITTLQQRLEIAEDSKAGQNDLQIAQVMGCSVYTVRKWRRREHKLGRPGLSSKMGRPVRGPLSTLPPQVAQTILQLRQQHPGWGPLTLLAELKHNPAFAEQSLPSRARVAAFLKQAGLTRRYQPHQELPPPTSPTLESPYQEWQMDAQGVIEVAGVGKVSLISSIDVVSRLKIESYPCQASKPALPDYQLALRRAFLKYGLPQRITLDHDTVYYDNTSPSPFPTRFHLWLTGLGVEISFTRKRQPTDHAIVERNHQTITAQALQGQQYAGQRALWEGLDQRREILNTQLPVRTLRNRTPLQAFPKAEHSGRCYQPQQEAELLSMERVYQYLAKGRWFRPTHGNGCFTLHNHNYYLSNQLRHRMIEITFEPTTRSLKCQPDGAEESINLPIADLTKADLMGELAALQALPNYQLAWPFTVEAWRQSEYSQILAA